MKKHRSAFVLEKLEPRLLFSADMALLPIDAGSLAVDQDVLLTAPTQFINDSAQVEESVDSVQREVIFIDTGVEDYQQLLADIQAQAEEGRQFETVLLDSNRDGIAQISDYLSTQQDISAVHIFSHGSAGETTLGNSTLNLETLDGYASQLESWQNSLTADADLLFYGCNLASGETGQSLISSLSLLTGADVAASDDLTGAAALGGDWDLEQKIGQVETETVVSSELQGEWQVLLDTISVTTTADTLDVDADTSSLAALAITPGSDGSISLREAIIAANNGLGADEIFLPAGTYNLAILGTGEDLAATGDLDIREDLTITGSGADVTTIDANDIDRVFDVIGSAGNVTLTGMTITNGTTSNSGGGIRVGFGNTVAVVDSEITENVAANLGGGIYSNGSTVLLTRATLSGNSAIEGGAIRTDTGSITILTNTTISANSASVNGGAIYTPSAVTIINSTIADNTSSGIGGIFTIGSGDADLLNTILSNNSGGNANKALTSSGHNIDSDGTAGLAGTGDQVAAVADIKLGALQNNGGTIRTHALEAGSVAIDAGDSASAAIVDARGFLRSDGLPDIGAYEVGTSAAATAYYLDQFNTAGSFAGDDGTLSWSNDWQEVDEPGGAAGAATGGVAVFDVFLGDGDYELKIGSSKAVWREADLSGAGSATLSFDYARYGMDADDDLVIYVQTGGNTGGVAIFDAPGTWDEILRISGPGDDAAFQTATVDLSDYMAADTRILIRYESVFEADEEIYIDNVRIDLTSSALTNNLEHLVHTADMGNPQETSLEDRGSTQAVAMDDSGNYVVVWSSLNQDGSGWGVYAQRFHASGAKQGGEILINSTTTDNQYWASVAMDAAGNFVVTWTSDNQDGTSKSVYASGFNTDGTQAFAEFRVNTTNTGVQSNSSIAMASDGRFVITWAGESSTDTDGIHFRRFDADGTALDASDQRANSVDQGNENNAVVTMNDSGQFAIAWEVGNDIFIRPFEDDGTAMWSQGSRINTLGTTADYPAIAMNAAGEVAITWRSQNSIHDGIWLQIYDSSDESKLPSAIQVDNNPAEDCTKPSISMDASENFIVTFEGSGDGDGLGVFGKIFDSSGNTIRNEFQINQTTTGTQHMASVAMLDTSNFVAVWSGNGDQPGETDDSGVFLRQYTSQAQETLYPIQDTYLDENNPDTNFGNATDLILDCDGGDLGKGHLLFQFDLSSIPAGTVITGASLELNATANSGVDVVEAYQITESWVEGSFDGSLGDASWVERLDGEAWSDAGGTYDAAVIDSISTSGTTGIHAFDLTSLVQDWIDGTTENNGIMIASPDSGGETITYDSREGTIAPNLIITFASENHPAVFGGDTSGTGLEDGADISGTVTATDTADGMTTPNFTVTSNGSNGTATINATTGAWTYTADADYNGSDAFTVQVTDDDGNNETQLISVTVTPVNDAATFGGDISGSGLEDGADISGTVTATDTADGMTTPNFTVTSNGSNGTATINATTGAWTYTADADYNGSDAFTVQVTDDDGNNETQLISVTVTPVNDAATFGGDISGSGLEDGADISGTVTATDTADGMTTPNFTVTSNGSNGTATINATTGAWTYTADADYNGSDAFTVQVTDDDGNNETQLISVTVTPVNDAATFGGDISGSGLEDGADISGTVTATDTADGMTTPNFTVTSNGSNGTATINATTGAWTYTADADYNGSDAFTVQVTDDDGNNETQLISVTVTPVNDAATFGGDISGSGLEDGADISGTVTATDTADGMTTPNFTVTSNGSNGTATINATTGAWTYTADADYNGSDAFTVQVTDDDGNNETQLISVTVTPVNDAATFGGDISGSGLEDGADISGTVTATDTADGMTTPNFTVTSNGSNGTATINATTGAWTYTADADYNGSDAFTVQVTDDDGNNETQLISVTVTPVNDAATFGGDISGSGLEDGADISGTVTATDTADGMTTPNFTVTSNGSNGTATINATTGAWTYTADADYNGSDAFTVQVTDDDGNNETQLISVTVTPVNDAPLITSTPLTSINEDALYSYTLTATDADTSDTLTLSAPTLPIWLTFNTTTGELSGTPTNAEVGDHSVVLRVNDGTVNVDQAFTITVTNVNDAPTAANDNLSVTEDHALTMTTITDLLNNDSDPEGDTLTLAGFTQPGHGTLIDNADGTLSYTPDSNFSGTDSFDYTISDGQGGAATGTAYIVVAPVGDTPQVDNASVVAGEQSGLIAINRNAADGAEVTHFRISGISGGTLYQANGTTQIHNGDYITVAQGQAGVRFTAAETATGGGFQVEASEDGFTVAAQSGLASSTISITPIPVVTVPDVEPPIETVEDIVEEDLAEEETETVEDILEEETPIPEAPPLTPENPAVTATAATAKPSLTTPFAVLLRDGGFSNRDDGSLSVDGQKLSISNILNALLETNPIETLKNSWDALDISALTAREYDLVRNSFDALNEEYRDETHIETAVISSAVATSIGLSAGYVVWMLKGGSLLASVLSSMPAWHLADPLSILSGMQRDDEDDESLESILGDSDSADDEDDENAETEKNKGA